MVSLDGSLGLQILNFLLLILILHRLLYKPILAMIAKRKKQLEASEAEIRDLQQTVDAKMAAYEARLLEIKNEAMERKNGIVSEGTAEATALIEAVREELPGMMDRFRSRLEEQMATAKTTLTDRSLHLSLDIAEKILERRLR